MNLDRLHAFVVFSEHLNFTRAAQKLAISQPALHAQIAKLSEELSVPLYVRQGRGLQLTAEGQKVAAFGRELIAQIEVFQAQLHGEARQQPVTLAAGEGSLLYLLGGAIQAFSTSAIAPLQLMTVDLAGTLAALRSGRAQVGVASLVQAPADITATLLTEVPSVILTPSTHPLAEGPGAVALTQLSGMPLIVPPQGRPHRQAVDAALLDAGVQWRVAVEANGWELMRRFVALGLGLAIVNGFCPPPRGCVARPIQGLPVRRYWILHREGARLSTAARSLIQILHQHAHDWRHDTTRYA